VVTEAPADAEGSFSQGESLASLREQLSDDK